MHLLDDPGARGNGSPCVENVQAYVALTGLLRHPKDAHRDQLFT
jgi:hypothetical protein